VTLLELRKDHLCLFPSLFLKYISLANPNLSLMKIFFRKETLIWIIPPHWASEGFLIENIKTMLESMVEENVKNGTPMIEKGLKVKKALD
jgi:hypothetical protein